MACFVLCCDSLKGCLTYINTILETKVKGWISHHLVFDISQLKPCRIDEGDPSKVARYKILAMIRDKLELEVDNIIFHI